MANLIDVYTPNIIETDDGPITQDRRLKNTDTVRVDDVDWVRSSFLVSGVELDSLDKKNRFFSSANAKFTDTTLGGNIAVNPRPQFTRYADIRIPGRRDDRNRVSVTSITGNYGMGRYYSEAIDDNAEKVYIRFGVPVTTSLVRFLRNAIDPNISYFVNTARYPIAGMIGRVIGVGLKIYMFPVIGTVHTLFEIASKLVPSATSKFYTLKPAMFMYWSTVNNIVSSMAIELGLLPLEIPNQNDRRIGESVRLNESMVQEFEQLFPQTVIRNGYVDVFAMVSRAPRLELQTRRRAYKQFMESGYKDYMGFVYDIHHSQVSGPTSDIDTTTMIDTIFNFTEWYEKAEANLTNIAQEITSNSDILKTGAVDDTTPIEIEDYVENEDTIDPIFNTPKASNKVKESFLYKFMETADAIIRDGLEWAIFNVNHTGSVSESFSNATQESSLKSQINAVSSTTRTIKFELGGALGDTVREAIGMVQSLVANTLSEVTYGLSNIVQALLGGGFIDVPKVWSDSTASLPSIDYSMRLISPYNHPISLLQNIYIPIAMLLAGALPRAVGKESYTSPFLCSVYNRGRQNISLGIIESITLTRGTSNLPFSRDGKALAIDVSFRIADLSTVMYMPIDSGVLFGMDTTLDEDNPFNQYLNTLMGKDLYSIQYLFPQMIVRAAKLANKYHGATSPYLLGSLFGNSLLTKSTIGLFVSGNRIIPRE